MEKEGVSSSSSGFSGVVDKKTSSNSSEFLHQTTTTQPFSFHHLRDDYHDGGGPNETASASAAALYRHQLQPSSTTTILQPFEIFHHSSYSTTPYNVNVNVNSSGGGGMAAMGGFPFTAAQWKELERQAMIYKCMISSVPVPPHLLFPHSTNFPLDSLYGGRYGRKGDPEPGRCKRTDGKKWRCAREVAPLQKYCERHLHRGRPRSRKPVELNNNNKKTTKTTQTAAASSHGQLVAADEPLPLFKPKTDLTISTPYYKAPTNRDLVSNLMESNINMGMANNQDYSSSFNQDYNALNLFSYPTSEGDLSTSTSTSSPFLNLSMATAAVSWEPFAGGGPLGEALHPASPMSTPATTVSSPSGVLHWTLFSHSDAGSVCNSPTLPPEISNKWHI